MWALLILLVVGGTAFSFLRSRNTEFRNLPTNILGNWQGRTVEQIYAFHPSGRCKISASTADHQYALIDGVYRLDKDILTLSIENQTIVRMRAFVNGDMLVLTSLENREKLLFNRF